MAQQVAAELGSEIFAGWRCPTCSSGDIHLRTYEAASNDYSRCPNCNELTVLKQESRMTEAPGLLAPGVQVTTYTCQCCHYQREIEVEVSPTLLVGNNTGSNSDFGGGSSGGGGAGASW